MTKANPVDKFLPHAFKEGSKRWTIGMLKAERLRVKNERRAKAGLPALADYPLV